MTGLWSWLAARSGWILAIIGLAAWFGLLWAMVGDVM